MHLKRETSWGWAGPSSGQLAYLIRVSSQSILLKYNLQQFNTFYCSIMTIYKKLQMDWAKSLHEAYLGLFPMLDLLMSKLPHGTRGESWGKSWGKSRRETSYDWTRAWKGGIVVAYRTLYSMVRFFYSVGEKLIAELTYMSMLLCLVYLNSVFWRRFEWATFTLKNFVVTFS